ncbi:SDR family NAD(P)-dependent oxidoreductase [Novosphingobium sp. G106]|uniref:SDR family NAD(P)-dependent oxidoreductase n=1 Tax=Novosphingobium sp. G106 TaxID=2849500 RepID=UPI00281276E0|nr:SDR family NAD(P)-dependent oxidoreductase [Novosphingobium sp. G106]
MMLAGKVVAVTGGGRGIGRAIALLCAQEGAAVLVNDPGVAQDGDGSDAGPAEQTAADIRAAGGQAQANLASVADPAGAQSIVADAIAAFGRIDAVVNNAGILRDAIWHKLSHEDWRAVIDVHLHGAFNVAKAATPHFREQQSGSFIHFTSGSGLTGNVGQANYAAAKLGIVGLSQSIALDMARYGVRSNCIAPVAFTRMIENLTRHRADDDPSMAKFRDMGPEKIAPLVAYLASDVAADVTNQVFGVRRNEIFLYSKPRILRSMAKSEGWTAQSIADELMPALRPDFERADLTAQMLQPYDPI